MPIRECMFEGMAIGGPRAGEFFASDCEIIHVTALESRLAFSQAEIADFEDSPDQCKGMTVSTHRYQFFPRLIDFGFGHWMSVWVHTDLIRNHYAGENPMTAKNVIDLLLKSYQDRTNDRRYR